MLLKNKAEYTKEVKEFSFLEAIPDINIVDKFPSPRALNTHFPYRWLPKQHKENGGKIVHVLRNPKDIIVSLYHHLKNTNEFGEIPDFKTFFEAQLMGPGKSLS
jgi:hypothetical protein